MIFTILTQFLVILEKMTKTPGDIIILQMCTINDNDRCMILEIWNATDRIFCHFGSTSRKHEKNIWRYHHFHKCIKNHDHRLYWSWDMAHDRYNYYFTFRLISHPFTPLTAQKIKFQKNEKNAWRCDHFTQVYQKSWSYAVLVLRYGMWQM